MQWMASAMRASRAGLETATHNLANVSSDGFRRFASHVAIATTGLRETAVATNEQGAIRQTGRAFDVALLGPGAFHVGTTTTRDGAFVRDRDGYLIDARGAKLHGRCGPLRVSEDAEFAADGTIRDRGRVVDRLDLPPGTTVQRGALETSNVNAIGETLAILQAQRSFETAQKVLSAIDETRNKAVNDVVRVK